jgi:hypothetical protein
MGIRFCKWLYRQWKLVEGNAKWDAIGLIQKFIWGLLVPGGFSAMTTGIVNSTWPGELSGPWLVFFFFAMYVLCFVFTAAFVTIAVKGKELLAEERLQEEHRTFLLRRKRQELEQFINLGDISLNQCKVRNPKHKIEESFTRWNAEVITYLQNFSDSDHVSCFLSSNNISISPSVAVGIPEEEKETYLLVYSRIMRLRQFLEEIEKQAPPGMFDVKQSSLFHSL